MLKCLWLRLQVGVMIVVVNYGIVFAAANDTATGQSETKRYQEAYNTCSPVVHQIVRRECHYGVVFERYYQLCMAGQGYSEDTELDPAGYSNYMEYHAQCTSSAQRSTEEACQYGRRYQRHYNQCMLKYGFNDRGDYVGKPKSNVSEDTQEEPGNRGQEGGEEYFEYDF
jgi:hypothetical protein